MVVLIFRFGKRQPVSFQLWKNYQHDKSKAKDFHFKYMFLHPDKQKVVMVFENLTGTLWNLHETKFSPTSGSMTCTVMTVFNLAEPEWISVSCSQKIPTNLVCCNTSQVTIHSTYKQSMTQCEIFSVRIAKLCYTFSWFEGKRKDTQYPILGCKKGHKSDTFGSISWNHFEFLFYAGSNDKFTIISLKNTTRKM